MIRLSPADAIFQGLVHLTDECTNVQNVTEVILDSYHKDVRFEFAGEVLFYNYHTNTFVHDPAPRDKKVSKFFMQELKDSEAEVVFISFILSVDVNGGSRLFEVQGFLVQQSAEKDMDPRMESFSLN